MVSVLQHHVYYGKVMIRSGAIRSVLKVARASGIAFLEVKVLARIQAEQGSPTRDR